MFELEEDSEENESLKNLSITLRSLSELLLAIDIKDAYSKEELRGIAQKGIKAVITLIDEELPWGEWNG